MHSQHTLYGHLAEAPVLTLGRADLNKTSTAGILTFPRRRSLPIKKTDSGIIPCPLASEEDMRITAAGTVPNLHRSSLASCLGTR